MKISRRQLIKVIQENLMFEQEDISSATDIFADEVKDDITNITTAGIEKAVGIDETTPLGEVAHKAIEKISEVAADKIVDKILESNLAKSSLERLAQSGAGTALGVAGNAFITFMFVGGLFTALPKMINASISALNTVPGKLRNFKKLKGSPVNVEDLAEKPSQAGFGEIEKHFGIKSITRDDMIDFLAYGIGIESPVGKNVNPVDKLFKDEIITEDFYKTVLKRYYQLREDKSPENYKRRLLAGLDKVLKDGNPDELTISAILDLASVVSA
jgi:hypothetical protein